MNYEVPTIRVALKNTPEQEMVINETDFDAELHVRVRVRVPVEEVQVADAQTDDSPSKRRSSKKAADANGDTEET